MTYLELFEINDIPYNYYSINFTYFVLYIEVYRTSMDDSIRNFIGRRKRNELNMLILASQAGLSAGTKSLAQDICKELDVTYDADKFNQNKMQNNVIKIIKNVWNDNNGNDTLYQTYYKKAMSGELDNLIMQ